MQRRLAIVIGSYLFCGAVALGDAPRKKVAEKPNAAGKTTARFVHAVTLPLKQDAPPGTADEMVADCHTMLGTIPSVRAVKAGRPADKDSVDFVKKDYSVGLIILV